MPDGEWMPEQLPPLTHVRDLDDWYDRRQAHARNTDRGREVRVARGSYVDTAPWQLLDQRGRYLLRVRAIAETRRHSMVLSHWSAAVLHGLPILGDWPHEVHVTAGPVSGGRSRNGVRKHALLLRDEDVIEIGGLLVTSIARTVLDLAVSADHLTAMMAVDRALLVDRFGRRPPLATREELFAAYERAGNFRGHIRAARVFEAGACRSESPLESVSRANMRVIGCPEPELQVSYFDHEGYIGDGDFSWPAFNLIGEADGDAKYLSPALRGDRSADQIVLDEKVREDRLRALPKNVTRWRWRTGVNPAALRAHLVRAGIPIR
jgi:hypothetical protein